MNLLLFEADELSQDGCRGRATGRRAAHVRSVHRAEVGRELRVGVVDGRVGRGRVLELRPDHVEFELQLTRSPPQDAGLHLVLALPRPKVLGRLLRDVASLGVKRITLAGAARVEKSYWQNHRLLPEWIREQLLFGLEQAEDTLLPRVEIERRFRPLVEDRLAHSSGARLVLHPEAAAPCPKQLAEFATLVIGPEGGFVPFELDLLAKAGFPAYHLGSRVLRTETIVPFALGHLRGLG